MRACVRCLLVVLVGVVCCGGLGSSAFAAGDANEAFCPQETEASPGFRGYLPDCRAYEVVTPQFKDGLPPSEGVTSGVLVSPDGSRVIVSSLGVLAGTDADALNGNDFLGALYELTRGEDGWSIAAIQPPQSRFGKFAEFANATSLDLTRTAWLMTETGKALKDLFVREPGGEFVEVGPIERLSTGDETTETGPQEGGPTAANVVGAGVGFNTFVLSLENHRHHSVPPLGSLWGSLWPGDPTVYGQLSLYVYEYTGTRQSEPLMVAVRNEGKLRSNTEAEPITVCGSELGAGHHESDYDAVSDGGDAIFFTADGEGECPSELTSEHEPNPHYVPHPEVSPKVNELYVRVAGEKTLDLSEPPLSLAGRDCTVGSACETDETTEADRGAAVFQGASAEGMKVFFTTEQPLVNAAEGAGRCLYEEGIVKEGLRSRVSSLALAGCGVEGVVGVSADGSRVYFVSSDELPGSPSNANSEGKIAQATRDNLYVYDGAQGRPVYIATLSSSDSGDWTASDFHRTAQASLPDGRFLAFASKEPLTDDISPQSKAGLSQLFEYDAEPSRAAPYGQLRRVSLGYENAGAIQSAAEQPKLPRQDFDVGNETGASQALDRSQGVGVSEDGAVFFRSEAKLTPQALHGGSEAAPYANVYEYRGGSVSLISDGRDTTVGKGAENPESVVQLISATSSGSDVFFLTADSLVPQDGDTGVDIYDAREDGGFPAPFSPVSCGEGCQGGGSTAPLLGAPSSSSLGGEANLPPAPPAAAKTKPKAKALTRAEKLTEALKACEKKSKRQRPACAVKARKQYGPAKAKKSTNGKGSK